MPVYSFRSPRRCNAKQSSLSSTHLVQRLSEEASVVTNSRDEFDSALLGRASVSRGFVFEILRLFPSSYWFAREVKTDMTLADIKLRKGDSLIVSPWRLHRDRRFWTDPENFNIDRSHMSNKAYVPFGSGPRACVGMGIAIAELQLLALMLASSCEIDLKSAHVPGLPRPSITLVPPEIEVEIRPRDHNAIIESAGASIFPTALDGEPGWQLSKA